MGHARTFAVGDVHGRSMELGQALERAEYNHREDRLIFLGDLMDRGPESKQVIDRLVSLRAQGAAVDWVGGNHCLWLRDDPDLINPERCPLTAASYYDEGLPQDHREAIATIVPYIDEVINGKRMLFVHGGYVAGVSVTEQAHYDMAWDRDFWVDRTASVAREGVYDKVFIGHTSLHRPTRRGRVTNIDCGAGYRGGRVCVADVETMSCHLSDPVGEPMMASGEHDASASALALAGRAVYQFS